MGAAEGGQADAEDAALAVADPHCKKGRAHAARSC